MKITILGAGPAGLYCGLLLKKADPSRAIRIIERNAPDATYGWGVVFSDRTLAAFQEADEPSYRAITSSFVPWESIDIAYRGQWMRCGGHVFAGMARMSLLAALQFRCRGLGVELEFSTDVTALDKLPPADLLIAADGVNSLARRSHERAFAPRLSPGRARYIWLGVEKTLDAFTFIFKESEHGLFQAHAYPFSGERSTFIVECAESVWQRAGLDKASEQESIAFCEGLFANELGGARLVSNNSRWINFATLKCAHWHSGSLVLLGDAAHTAHFSIGSGTKLAMEDAIALARAMERYTDLERALTEYELERRPVVTMLQAAAAESQAYFESTARYTSLSPAQFAFNLLTRSKRITYDDLRLRDPYFVDWVDRSVPCADGCETTFAPPPLFTPMRIGATQLPTRVVTSLPHHAEGVSAPIAAGTLSLTEPLAVSAEGRIHAESAGLYATTHESEWTQRAQRIHEAQGYVCALLNHAGRRGATRTPGEGGAGVDRPLRTGSWPLLSASPIPYTPVSQTPGELTRAGMDETHEAFVAAARMADRCGFDLLMLHMAHGYLLASFLSPLTNQRADDYGGSPENRMRFPLKVFRAVRAIWPADKPLGVALNCADGARDGLTVDEAVAVALALKAEGCELIQPLAGQTTTSADLPYGRAFLTPLAERLRLDVGLPVLVGGYLTTTGEANTILAGGRADLTLLTLRPLRPTKPTRETREIRA